MNPARLDSGFSSRSSSRASHGPVSTPSTTHSGDTRCVIERAVLDGNTSKTVTIDDINQCVLEKPVEVVEEFSTTVTGGDVDTRSIAKPVGTIEGLHTVISLISEDSIMRPYRLTTVDLPVGDTGTVVNPSVSRGDNSANVQLSGEVTNLITRCPVSLQSARQHWVLDNMPILDFNDEFIISDEDEPSGGLSMPKGGDKNNTEAEKRKVAEEKLKLDEQIRIDEEERSAKEKERVTEEKQRLAQVEQSLEKKRLAEKKQHQEKERFAEEKRRQVEARVIEEQNRSAEDKRRLGDEMLSRKKQKFDTGTGSVEVKQHPREERSIENKLSLEGARSSKEKRVTPEKQRSGETQRSSEKHQRRKDKIRDHGEETAAAIRRQRTEEIHRQEMRKKDEFHYQRRPQMPRSLAVSVHRARGRVFDDRGAEVSVVGLQRNTVMLSAEELNDFRRFQATLSKK